MPDERVLRGGRVQTTPNVPLDPGGGTDNDLNGVSCTSATFCVSAGWGGQPGGLLLRSGTIVQKWDGSTWTLQTTPDGPGPQRSDGTHQLNGISCDTSGSCTSVGASYPLSTGSRKPIAERWDGTRWSLQSPASGSGQDSQLQGVSCASGSSCVAVGSTGTASEPSSLQTLAEAWDGNSWAVQPTPNPAGTQVVLNGVSCTPDGSCAAVGGSSEGALVERYAATAAQPPHAITLAASVSDSVARLRGSVNPEGSPVNHCEFVWGPTTAYGHSAPCRPDPGSGTASVAVSARITRLVPGSTYHYRLIAGNAAATQRRADWVFTTPSSGGYTVGNASVGDYSDEFLANYKRVNAYTLVQSGTLLRMNVFLAPTSTAGQQVLRGIVYANSSGTPSKLLSATLSLTFRSSDRAGWYGLVFAHALHLSAGRYWLGVLTGGTAHVAGWRTDLVAGSRDVNWNPLTSGPSNPFGSFAIDDEQMSLYASYRPDISSSTASNHRTAARFQPPVKPRPASGALPPG